MPRYKT